MTAYSAVLSDDCPGKVFGSGNWFESHIPIIYMDPGEPKDAFFGERATPLQLLSLSLPDELDILLTVGRI
jgi:hypothetical protein